MITGTPVRIAVLIPCLNEAVSIGKVVADFIQALPSASIFVYDNNSSDGTGELARAAGAVVRQETRQGKGHVVRRMFSDVEADVYILVDGDDTYDAASAPALVKRLIEDRLDVANAMRVTTSSGAYRSGHRFGNVCLSHLVASLFEFGFKDMLSGYKVFSRRFVKSFPALASGFEIETELAVHALAMRMPTAEVPTPYKERPAGSQSKLRTFRDGYRIIVTIFRLLKQERPLAFLGALSVMLAAISLVFGIPVVVEFLETGLVPRLPTAVLAMGIMLLAFLALTAGLILDTVTYGRREMKRLHYLSLPLLDRYER